MTLARRAQVVVADTEIRRPAVLLRQHSSLPLNAASAIWCSGYTGAIRSPTDQQVVAGDANDKPWP